MKISKQAKKFGFSSEDVRKWKDKPFVFQGSRDVGVVLVHGWSSMPKQVLPIAKKLNKLGYWISAPRMSGHGTKPEDLEWATSKHWIGDLQKDIENLKKRSGVSKIVVGGISLGGNIALLTSEKIRIDGFIFIGTPVFLRSHFGIWCGLKVLPKFKKYIKKTYPNGVVNQSIKSTSYQYYPLVSATEVLRAIRRSLMMLRKVDQPVLVLQANTDYLVSKLSLWLLFNSIASKEKKMQWIKTKGNGHVLNESDIDDSMSIVENFLKKI